MRVRVQEVAMSNLGDANNVFAFRCATIEIDGDALRPVTCAVIDTVMALVEVQAKKLEGELKNQPGPARQKVKISVRFDPQLIAMIGDRAMYEVTLEALPGGAA
jgi:hypothetical protein